MEHRKIDKDADSGFNHIDVAALARFYNTPPVSRSDHEDILEQARTALMKYELTEDEREIAADALARSMQMPLEQSGLKKLEPERMAALEQEVLNWCGFCHNS